MLQAADALLLPGVRIRRQTLPGDKGILERYCRLTDRWLSKTPVISGQSHFESFGTLLASVATIRMQRYESGAPNDNLSQCRQCCYRAENQPRTSRSIPNRIAARSDREPIWQARVR